MLISMTGFGEAVEQKNGSLAQVEIRSVNNRHLKSNVRLPEGYGSLEARIDVLLKESIRRGTVYVNLQITHEANAVGNQINLDVLQAYYDQLAKLKTGNQTDASIPLSGLLELPGVLNERSRPDDVDQDWPLIENAVAKALKQLQKMRIDEGSAMQVDLADNRKAIEAHLDKIAERAPIVVSNYQDRLKDRLTNLLQEYDVQVQPQEVIREVGIFADRADISEEIVRLRSHFEQFDEVLLGEESNGRKLEFLIQEMFRETNTIGSKANDAEISKEVVEIKTVIERLREMVQNVE